jgi:hypothetical protein
MFFIDDHKVHEIIDQKSIFALYLGIMSKDFSNFPLLIDISYYKL